MNNIIWPKSYIAWDLETSGLDPKKDFILEIGAMRVENGEIVERMRWVLNNGIEIPAKITAINGMTNEIITNEGKDPRVCLTEFLEFIKDGLRTNLTHNGFKFDAPFLAENLKRILPGRAVNFDLENDLRRYGVDTAVIAKAEKLGMSRQWNEDFREWADRVMSIRIFGVKYNLGLCCDEYGVDRSNIQQHRALGDVELTHALFKKMVEKNCTK